MNILFVTGCFAKNERDMALSGMPNAVFKSAVGMWRRGHKVRILAVDERDRQWHYQGIEVISVQAENPLAEKYIWNNMLCILKREHKIEKKIRQLYKEESIDIIQYTGWFGIGLLHFSNIPAVMRVSSYTKTQLAQNYSQKIRILLSIAEYLAAKRMNYIFAPSRLMAESLAKDIKRSVGIIETPYFSEKVELDDSVFKEKIENKKYILFFGRMSVDKGILTIRDILYRVLKEHLDIFFVFAGISCEHDGVIIEKELIRASQDFRDRVIFLGLLPQSKLIPVIKNAEMVLMPSLADNFPNTCAEAMALGKIVIGTEGSSLEQFIKDKENGCLAEIGNAESLYDCVKYVLNMEDVQKEDISNQAMKRIKKLDLEQYSLKMELLYEKVIDKVREA